jgi:hypothetical protein
MSSSILVFAFLLIVFAPCMLAFDGWKAEEGDWGIPNKWRGMRRMGRVAVPLQAGEPEREIGADFEIRRFAKGISQRRLLIQDTEDGPKVTIAQLREAAAELVKLGGMVVARQLAMAAALIAAAGKSVADAARETYAWMAWHDARTLPAEAWDQGPPVLETISMFAPEHLASRAA